MSINCLCVNFVINLSIAHNRSLLKLHTGLRGLWSLTPLSTIFKLYRGGQFLFGG